MLNATQYYKMDLEDFRFPRISAKVRPYYGTMDDFLGLTTRISEWNGPAVRYADTIDALESFPLDQEVCHWMAGQRYPLLTPLADICRYDTILQDQHWDYRCYHGGVYHLQAKEVRVSQILLQGAQGYDRCLRASFTELQACFPKFGWYYPDTSIQGFPGMVTWKDHVHTVHLFVSQCHYRPEDREQALKDMTDPNKIRLDAVVGDIFGEM